MKIPQFLHRFSSPRHFDRMAAKLLPWLGVLFVALIIPGLYLGLVSSPVDYQQGDTVRIMYIHVPAAWMSMFLYVLVAVSSAIFLIWKMKLADIFAAALLPVGAVMTLLALATGSLWGKPMWGTWWFWDARLTSELVLLFLYLGIIGIRSAFADPRQGGKAAAVLALVGTVNLPIIHYSVVWWNTLHQGATVSKMAKPSIAVEMLVPLLLMALAFKVFALMVALRQARCENLSREQRTGWAEEAAKS
jgi:heme exporter protein C